MENTNQCLDTMRQSQAALRNSVSAAWETVSEDVLASSFLTCGISYNSDGTKDVLIRDSIPREFGAEDVCDVEDSFQVLDEEDAGGVVPFIDPVEKKNRKLANFLLIKTRANQRRYGTPTRPTKYVDLF